jgi:CheY-like chemotaxis protein
MKTRVLVIDDDQAILQFVTTLLESSGYEERTVVGGEAGLKAALAFAPDVVLLDVQMPALDGYEVCRRLRQEASTQQTPVVMFTTSKDYQLNRQAYAAGAQACLPKPFRREALLALLEAVRLGMPKTKGKDGA